MVNVTITREGLTVFLFQNVYGSIMLLRTTAVSEGEAPFGRGITYIKLSPPLTCDNLISHLSPFYHLLKQELSRWC
jgi:hypothetical protein